MNRQLYEILTKWLKEADYEINFSQFEISLLSHPDYNSLTSITDTLAEFDIEHTAASIPFEALVELTEPFLAFIKQDYQEQFALIYPLPDCKIKICFGRNQTTIISIGEFEHLWTGTIVAIEKKRGTKKFKLNIRITQIALILVVLFSLFIGSGATLSLLIYFCLSLAGLFISGLIVNHQLGYSNSLSSKFCSLSKNTDCESVLNSKAAKLTEKIGLSDVGIIYFSCQTTLSLLFIFALKPAFILLFTISLSVIPFIAYSLYQQKFVIKKWCPLCLGVISVLLVQGIIAVFAYTKPSLSFITIKLSLFILLVVAVIIVTWYLLLPLLKAAQSLRNLSIEALSFRRNYHLLFPYMQSQPSISMSNDFKTVEIGNPNGELRLIAVTNPLCNSCIDTHKILYEISNAQKNISIKLLFYVPENSNDPRTVIAGNFLSLNNVEAKKVVENWYNNPNPKIFLTQSTNKITQEISEVLEKHKYWCHSNKIYITPTLIINGKRFPNFYQPADIQYFIDELLLSYEGTREKEVSNMVLVDNT